MNNIYDIVLNFNKNLYEFFEWSLSDDIIHIRKIPLIKVNSKNLLEIKNNKIKLCNSMLNKIKFKTELFTKLKTEQFAYSCLFCDGTSVLGIIFNKNGVSKLKSSMLLDEEMEVLDFSIRLEEKDIDYKIIKQENMNEFMTREEKEIDDYIRVEINKITNVEKLKYIYYECFDEIEHDENEIIKKINNELQHNWMEISAKLYNFFKLTSINK